MGREWTRRRSTGTTSIVTIIVTVPWLDVVSWCAFRFSISEIRRHNRDNVQTSLAWQSHMKKDSRSISMEPETRTRPNRMDFESHTHNRLSACPSVFQSLGDCDYYSITVGSSNSLLVFSFRPIEPVGRLTLFRSKGKWQDILTTLGHHLPIWESHLFTSGE